MLRCREFRRLGRSGLEIAPSPAFSGCRRHLTASHAHHHIAKVFHAPHSGSPHAMIDLGLSRTYRLLHCLGNPHLSCWKAIHVAGTNGKGSICAYIASCLHQSRIPTGRFTSPHLINRWDCIWVNGKSVEEEDFKRVEKHVSETNFKNEIGATEFELLTATAFEIFRQQRVQVAVIEVGVGGRLDSTNVLSGEHTLATVISKVGLDHQSFLGSTLEAIAKEKAGIVKEYVPCIVDATNEESVLETTQKVAKERSSPWIKADPSQLVYNVDPKSVPLLGDYQLANLSCALNALKASNIRNISDDSVNKGVACTEWHGRLQWIEYQGKKFLLDGAHNGQAAQYLSQYLDTIRTDEGLTIVMGFSQGKDFDDIMKTVARPNDRIIATSFGPVDSMPWVHPCATGEIAEVAKKYCSQVKREPDVRMAIKFAPTNSVICGSLYLVSDVLRHCQKDRHSNV